MDAVEFFKTRERICSQFKACSGCEFDDGSFNCPLDNVNDPENAVKLVEKWAKEHPRKTNLEKIKELFPDITCLIIGERDIILHCIDHENFSGTCFWDREFKEKSNVDC